MNATAEALRQRSFDFAVKTVKLSRYLSETKHAWVLARQVLRSGTSIGANIRESRFADDSPFTGGFSANPLPTLTPGFKGGAAADLKGVARFNVNAANI